VRTRVRLLGLKAWVQAELCDGRVMKAPGEKQNIAKVQKQEPRCHIGWTPRRIDQTPGSDTDPYSDVPGILIMPNPSKGKYTEEKRFDRYKGVNRTADLGQTLSITLLFKVYDPGTRLEGFTESAESGKMDLKLLTEGTEEGVLTLFDWMDDCVEKLLGQKYIPNTDLFVDEESVGYSLYIDQDYVVDRRPLFYGFVNADFKGYANESVNQSTNQSIEDCLK
jgi:hypothetical protein